MSTSPPLRNVIIDTDIGMDDCLALMMMLRAHRDPNIPIRIVGITCVDGNTSVDNATINARRILNLLEFDAKEIPVFRGAESPLVLPFIRETALIHGTDGLGDALEPFHGQLHLSEEPAPLAMIRLAKEYKGNLTLLMIGPLTNLALASRIHPGIKDDLREIFIMGGNTQGWGNVKISAEFNFAWDPESAYIVLNTFKCPMTIIPLEACRKNNFSYEWRVLKFGRLGTLESQFLNRIEGDHIETLCKGPRGYIPYDAFASALLLEPNVASTMEEHFCTVETQGRYSRGGMVLDHFHHLGKDVNARVLMDVNRDLFERMLFWAVRGSPTYK